MRILGLTGSIGMGKSTAAAMLRRAGIPVHDADATVHRLMAPGGRAVAAVAKIFPGVVIGQKIDRQELGRRVFGDLAALRRLEAILHPLVHGAESDFLRRCARRRVRLVVLDIPLLFETGGFRRCDAVAVVSCPLFLQSQRVLRRPGMTRDRLAAIRRQQMPDSRKRRLADFIIPTGRGRGPTLQAILRAAKVTLGNPDRTGAWPPRLRPRFQAGKTYA